ncbi:uncharacterized protein L969DRAFT_91428 [Mixia osmundae IAM 14324]|uniref:Ubiquitin-activating enzyme E1-like n=1 Tax=Mixia osmundae (strain CBS 9802 / IAM 14324 / JCM 22182 / KY 12970) TaxID=764103 RepID=G7E3V5_MIXOS|nr:uncharacterized protein L969DRAFT_91428 [Mixia osmundae IAM 14324]KEI41960.1 hypothetical protein L969DRAFT_91428 [Mixia osmundae IAM 14324]GAA97515.1 hypothetical protein E5Q_04193 [Mixia osmundae IAM 14324]
MSSDKARYRAAELILGNELFGRVQSCKVLMVGAGGIGCELLKNLVTSGFADITIIDLDTIDLSNLNRQFLFQKQHVKRSKAYVAKESASKFNPHVRIEALHGNIKEPQFDTAYFAQFDLVLNALDNLDARRHVNKMCLIAKVPLIESGTSGYMGQVQPIYQGRTECYDCQTKPTPKTFPVCTIRSTPSTPIHCIVWAKSYLFPRLFGSDDEQEGAELDKAAARGENAGEIDNLRKEAAEIKAIRKTVHTSGGAQRVFEKVYSADINRLLSMEDMWRARQKPTPLSWTDLTSATEASTSRIASGGLRDQHVPSLNESFQLFVSSMDKLSARVRDDPDTPLEWDKDDEDALKFSTAAANLRATAFGIPVKSQFDVKQMAGNIIPAIATTNAIVAGLIVLQALHALRKEWSQGRFVWVAKDARKATSITQLSAPSPTCASCQMSYVPLRVNLGEVTLSELVKIAQEKLGYGEEVVIVEESRLLYDPDFDDNLDRTLASLDIKAGSLVMVSDEDGLLSDATFVISDLPNGTFELPKVPPSIPKKPVKEEATDAEASSSQTRTSTKRTIDEVDAEGSQSKRARVDASGAILIDDDEEQDKTAATDGVIDLD